MKNVPDKIEIPMTSSELKKEVKRRVIIGEEYEIRYRSHSEDHKSISRNEKSRLVALYPHHMRFINKKNINICLTYFEVYLMISGYDIVEDKYFLTYKKGKKRAKRWYFY